MKRRRFLGLLPLAVAGCKIEAILDLPPSPDRRRLDFPDLPPKIPDQLEDAEATLQALTDELFAAEIPRLTQGDLREREIGDEYAVHHFEQLLRSFGLQPAGPRGGWRQAVELRSIEPAGREPTVVLRAESLAPAFTEPEPEHAAGPSTDEAPKQPEAPKASSSPEAAESPVAPAEGEGPETADGEAEPELAVALHAHGAFRQLGSPSLHVGLPTGKVLQDADKLPKTGIRGRVVWLRAPKDFDALADEAPARFDSMVAKLREAGAVGCVLLTRDEGSGVARFRERWRRILRRADDVPSDALLIAGLLDRAGSERVEELLLPREVRVLDVDLGTRERSIETHNVIGRMVGRERPGEAVILTCAWDTPQAMHQDRDTLRLLASLGAVRQLADWQRRSTRSFRSIVVLLTADGGIGAGQLEHARWSSVEGTRPTVVFALDRPTQGEPLPAALLAGLVDEQTQAIAEDVLANDGRDLLLGEELTMPSLAPYLRYQHPVMAIGEPPPEVIEELELSPAPEPEAEAETPEGGETGETGGTGGEEMAETDSEAEAQPLEALQSDVRMLRNLSLALAARRDDDEP